MHGQTGYDRAVGRAYLHIERMSRRYRLIRGAMRAQGYAQRGAGAESSRLGSDFKRSDGLSDETINRAASRLEREGKSTVLKRYLLAAIDIVDCLHPGKFQRDLAGGATYAGRQADVGPCHEITLRTVKCLEQLGFDIGNDAPVGVDRLAGARHAGLVHHRRQHPAESLDVPASGSSASIPILLELLPGIANGLIVFVDAGRFLHEVEGGAVLILKVEEPDGAFSQRAMQYRRGAVFRIVGERFPRRVGPGDPALAAGEKAAVFQRGKWTVGEELNAVNLAFGRDFVWRLQSEFFKEGGGSFVEQNERAAVFHMLAQGGPRGL